MNSKARFWVTPGIAGILLVLVGCSGAGADQVTPQPSVPLAESPAADTTFVADLDVGGRTMHIVCIGPLGLDQPIVIFEHGLGGDFGVWANVLTKVGETHRGCSYDRAGSGMSERAPRPRTTRDQVTDLRALLEAAGVGPPYLLVGHSSGAYNVLVHAAGQPDDVAGMVLVDPRPPTASNRFLAELPPESATEADVIHQYRTGFTEWESDPSGNAEGLDLSASAAEAESARDLGSIPLIVLAADGDEGEGSDLDPVLAARFETIWAELQAELASRSSAGRLELIGNSTHDMPFDRPDAIVDAIEEILGG
jgi:pimeloyl-ACP methyl ester carboxylesterase